MELKIIKIIILAGPPGSGKGTQAQLLGERFELEMLQANRLVREKFETAPNDPDVIESKKAYEEGRLTDGEVIGKWLTEKVEKISQETLGKGLILEGFARTLKEAKITTNILKEKFGLDHVRLFFIKIDPEETLKRNLVRIICQSCQKPIEPSLIGKITHCPYCGGELGKRDMDNKLVIENRLRVYQEETLPAIDYLRSLGIVVEINGEQPIESVYADILENLN